MIKSNFKIFVVLFLFFLALPARAGTKMVYQEGIIYGGTEIDSSRGIDFNSNGDYIVVGVFEDVTDFDPGVGVDNKVSVGHHDAYIVRYDLNDNYLGVKVFGGTSADSTRGIAFDDNDDYVVVGYFSGTVDFDPGVGVDNITAVGSGDGFISRYSSDNDYLETIIISSTMSCGVSDIKFGPDGYYYLVGTFGGTVDLDPGVGVESVVSNGFLDVYILKFDSDWNYIESKTFGGTSLDRGFGIDFDSFGNYYVSGSFKNTVDFDPGVGVNNQTALEFTSFLSKFDSSGNYIDTVVSAGGNAYGVVFVSDGGYYLVGSFTGTQDFDPSVGVDNKTSAGGLDGYISRFNSSREYIETKTIGSVEADNIQDIELNSEGDFYLVGEINGTVDMDTGVNVDVKTTLAGSNDSFIMKYSSVFASIQNSKTSVAVEKVSQTSDVYTVSLSVEPSANVVINISTSDTEQTSVSPSVLTFTPENYSTSQTITVRGVDNNTCITSSQEAIVSHNVSSSDYDYNNLSMANVTVNISDNNCVSNSLPFNFQASPLKPIKQGGNVVDFKIKINNGDEYTYSRDVKLNFIAGSDTTRVAFSENIGFEYAPLYDYLPEMDFQLSAGYGEKTVYAKFYTKYGYSTDVMSDNINYKIVGDKKDGLNNNELNNILHDNIEVDLNLSNSLKGKILLQVESVGEAWYINPETLKRHYLGRPDDSFRVMRE